VKVGEREVTKWSHTRWNTVFHCCKSELL